MENIYKNFRAEIKSVNEEKKQVTAIVSHAKKDRDGDIIPPDAMKKRIKRYKDHPVLLINHDYQVQNQIGKAVNIKLNDDHVEATFEYFAGMGNANADWAFELAKKGLASYSIGFQAFGFDWIEEKDESGTKKTTGRKFTDIELLEVSQVVVPANALALQAMFDQPDTDQDQKEICELVLKGIKAGEITPIKDEQPDLVAKAIDESAKKYAKLFDDMILKATSDLKKENDPEMAKQISDLKVAVSGCITDMTSMKSRLLMLEQQVQALKNQDDAEDIQNNAEAVAGGDPAKSYIDQILKQDDKTKDAGAGADKPTPTPDAGDVDVVSLVKDTFKKINMENRK